MDIERINVLGVGISVLDQDRAREFLFEAVREGRRGYVTITNVYSVSEAHRDPALRDIFNRALLSTPDGMPMVWMGKLQGHSTIRRVYGPDLMLDLCEKSQEPGFTHFFYGGKPGVADDLVNTLRRRFPSLKVVGSFCPPFRQLNDVEIGELRRRVREARPDFFWVGMSTVTQERFMAQYLSMLPEAKIFIGVGAAFDFLTGHVKQAPRWMMRMGLEWLFRLKQEPRRLAKRYLVYNPLFIVRAAAQLAKGVLQRPRSS
jgi:N-acetylglucosaminyldiphosphoundecaprenol N-acetyl-beta-D-mannosaminyltransferase